MFRSAIRSRPTTPDNRPMFEDYIASDNENLSLVEVQRRRAKDVLRSLQHPIPLRGKKTLPWGQEQNQILSANLGVLLDSIQPKGQIAVVKSKSATGTKKTKTLQITKANSKLAGQKRVLEETYASESDLEPIPFPAPKRTKRQITGDKDPRKLEIDLTFQKFNPIRIQYNPHPLEDRPDHWWISQFEALYKVTMQHTEKYFGIHDLSDEEPWDLEYTREFLHWTKQVAEADPFVGGWDILLKEPIHRNNLIAAIIVRIFKLKIFDSDLFGANTYQKELLHSMNRATIGREGFHRTQQRSENVRSILGRSPITENFYTDVAELTAQIYLLLNPLTKYLRDFETRNQVNFKHPGSQYQSLHNLVSRAAHLSICIRLSPTIFYWVDVLPGTHYDADDHRNIDIEIWTASKIAVTETLQQEYTDWKEERTLAEAEMEIFAEKRKEHTTSARETATRLRDIILREPKKPTQIYRAMAKIGVWPSIKRFKPGTKEDEKRVQESKMKIPLYEMKGSREVEINRACIISYYGQADRMDERESLEGFLKDKRLEIEALRRKGSLFGKFLVSSTLLAVGVGVATTVGWQINACQPLHFDFGSAVELVGDQVKEGWYRFTGYY